MGVPGKDSGFDVFKSLAGERLHRRSLNGVGLPASFQHRPDATAYRWICLVFWSTTSQDREYDGNVVLKVAEWQFAGKYLH